MPKLHNAHQQPCLHPHSWFWNLCGYRKKKYATKSLSPSLQTDPSGDQIPENERHRLTLPMKLIYVRLLGSWVTSENYQWQRSTCVTGILQLDILPPHSFLHILQGPHSFPEFPLPPHQKQPGCTLLLWKLSFSWNLLEGTHTHLLGLKSPQSAPPCCYLSMTLITLLINFLFPPPKKCSSVSPGTPNLCVIFQFLIIYWSQDVRMFSKDQSRYYFMLRIATWEVLDCTQQALHYQILPIALVSTSIRHTHTPVSWSHT